MDGLRPYTQGVIFITSAYPSRWGSSVCGGGGGKVGLSIWQGLWAVERREGYGFV